MAPFKRLLPAFLLGCLASSIAALQHHSFSRPLILADTNRDGVVNQLDAVDKDVWKARRGAIFLPNIGDSLGRCPAVDLTAQPLNNDEVSRCHDASGDRLLPSSYLYTAPLLTVPMLDLSDDAVGHIYIDPAHTRDRVRIFWNVPADSTNTTWALVDRQISFNTTSLRRGITLALDGRRLVTDSAIWDGSVKVVFEVTDRNQTARDCVALKQAPVLLHHHLQRAEVVLSTASGGNLTAESAWQAHFLNGLEDAVNHDVPIVLFNQSTDIWAQDFLEPGYATMPGPDGPISIRILLRSAQSTREARRQVFSQLRSAGIGGFQPGSGSGLGFEEINSGGNIESIPPYTSRSGKPWPHGRIITGTHFGTYPANSMITFLRSQAVQTPLFLETGWLAIGHVDEMVQVLPTNTTSLGFTLAIADTTSALALLHKVNSSGHGSTPFLSYNGSATPDNATVFLDPSLFSNSTTVSSMLHDTAFLNTQAYAQQHITTNLALLLHEIPLKETDILRVPTLFKDVTYPWPATPDGLPGRVHRAAPGERLLKGLLPQAINGLVLGGDMNKYIAPRQWGPVVDGEDVFGEEVKRVYGRVGMEVVWVDDYMTHHVRGGEVHCGTNVLRAVEGGWWEEE